MESNLFPIIFHSFVTLFLIVFIILILIEARNVSKENRKIFPWIIIAALSYLTGSVFHLLEESEILHIPLIKHPEHIFTLIFFVCLIVAFLNFKKMNKQSQ